MDNSLVQMKMIFYCMQDGCIEKTTNRFVYTENDEIIRPWLEQLKIKTYEYIMKNKCKVWRFNSRELKERVNEYEIDGRCRYRSLTGKIQADKVLVKEYIRAAIDCNGCLGLYYRPYNNTTSVKLVMATSSKKEAEQLAYYSGGTLLKSRVNKNSKLEGMKESWIYRISITHPEKLFHLFKFLDFHLDHPMKQKILENICDFYSENLRRPGLMQLYKGALINTHG